MNYDEETFNHNISSGINGLSFFRSDDRVRKQEFTGRRSRRVFSRRKQMKKREV